MGALQDILEYKKMKDAEAQADIQAIPKGVAAFIDARNIAQKSQLDQMLYNLQAQKFNLDVQKAPLETMKLQQDILESQSKIQARQNFPDVLKQFTGGTGSMGITGATLDEDGNLKYTIGETPQSKDARELANKEKEANIKNTADARKNLDEYMSNAGEALQALDKLENKATALGDFKRGVKNQVLAKADIAVKKFGQDKSLNEFTQSISQEMAPLVRKLAEEKGPLTDKDIERAIEGVGGDPTRPLEDKVTAINDLRTKVFSAINNKSQIAQVTPDELLQKYPNVMQKISTNKNQNNPKERQNNDQNKSDIVSEAMKKYPNKSREEIVAALKKRGLI